LVTTVMHSPSSGPAFQFIISLFVSKNSLLYVDHR